MERLDDWDRMLLRLAIESHEDHGVDADELRELLDGDEEQEE